MTDFALVLSSLRSRWLNSVLSILLTAFGVMLAVIIAQFGDHIQSRLQADGRGVDIVVGAKGSPLQLVLSSIYHIDIPTGNIAYAEAEKWMRHPQVRTAIPLALGDNWKGYRVVGTTHEYLEHYRAALDDGQVWTEAFEAVAGASVGLSVGDEFAGAHGLMGSGHAHEEERYRVVGVLKSTGTVLDRLIVTSLDSVLELHGFEGVEHHDDHEHDAKQAEDSHVTASHPEDGHDEAEDLHHVKEEPTEITALLIRTKSPIANMNLPRTINNGSSLQAANPALEIARLTSMLGLGSKSFAALSALLISIAVLSIFAGLAGSLESRLSDLAVLRAIGFSKSRIFRIITLEGLVIVVCGLVCGLWMGLGGFAFLARIVPPLGASGAKPGFTPQFLAIVIAVLVAGLAAAVFPALRASRVDVARQLSRHD